MRDLTVKNDGHLQRRPSRTKPGTARGVGTYASQACNVCRHKKIKCDSVRPVCKPCETSGRYDECSWGRESARKPRTEAHFEALRKRADALEEYANLLESKLEKCRREHGGLNDNGHSYLRYRPLDADAMVPDDLDVVFDDDMASDTDEDLVQELCLPTKKLVLEDRDLLFYGPNSIFIFAPPVPSYGSRFPEIAENSHECYVLMVEGVDESNYNPNFDWSRHLTADVPLDRREHDKILNLLFKFFTSWCLRIVPALFLRDMYRALSGPRSQTPPKTAHYSPMLHNALIALASAFSDDLRIRDIKSRQYFANTAKNYIEDECQKPNISVVHALSILGSYHSSQGDQTLGYIYFGMSARISQALGLSTDCSTWVSSGLISHDDMLDRNWAHWTTFSQDVCWSLYVGRDSCVPLPSDRQRIPVPFVDSDFDQMPWHYPPSNIPPQPNFLSRTFAATCELLLIARRIMDVVNSINRPGTRHEINHELISKIDLQLNTWKERLSPEVDITLSTRRTSTPHLIMMHLAYWWLFILLHRPFYRRLRSVRSSDKDIDHVKLCNRAAENIMELLDAWHSLYNLRYAPITLIQVLFSTGTVFLLSAVQAASGLRVGHGSLKHFLSQGELCIKYLLESGKSWQCGTNIAGILRNLLQQQLNPILARRSLDRSHAPVKDPSSPSSPRKSSIHARKLSTASAESAHTHSPSDPSSPVIPSQVRQPSASTHHGNNWAFNSNPVIVPTDRPWNYADPQTNINISDPSDSFGTGPAGMQTSGMLGIPGGEMIPDLPFIPYGMLDSSGAYLNPLGYTDPEVQDSPDIGDSDLVALQQFLNEQSERMDMFVTRT